MAIDWSGRRGPDQKHALWLGEALAGELVRLESGRTRDDLVDLLIAERDRDPNLVVGLDLAFSLPAWFLEERALDAQSKRVGSVDAGRPDRARGGETETMPFTRAQIRDSVERAGDAHWQALIQHHTDAYPESPPTPGDVARAEAERLNDLGLGDNPSLHLLESRVERVGPAVRITHVFEDRDQGTRFETEPFTGYE